MSQLIKLGAAPELVDQVYRALLDAISDGSLAPGTCIKQEDIAAQLSVSRQPVLQALRLLKKDGFVLDAGPSSSASTRARGLLVAPIDAAWIANVYQVRSALDALAARLCCVSSYNFDSKLFDKLIAQGRKAAAGRKHQSHDRSRHGVSQRDLRGQRQRADRAKRASALAPHSPRHGCCAASELCARVSVRRAPSDCRRDCRW